jgi:hypothetical protein
VRRLQAPELQHDEEQEEDDGADRVQQVLPLLPEAYGAQGNEINVQSSIFNLRIFVGRRDVTPVFTLKIEN